MTSLPHCGSLPPEHELNMAPPTSKTDERIGQRLLDGDRSDPHIFYCPQRSPEPTRSITPRQKWGVLNRVRAIGKQFGRKSPQEEPKDVEEEAPKLCLLEDSPYRVIKVASRGNLDEFEKVYKADPKRLKATDNKGQTPLHAAAAKGHRNIVDFIIKQHGCLDATDNSGDTALHTAVRHNQPGVVEALLQGGADHSILNDEQMAPLHLACDLGHVEVVKALLIDPNVDRNIKGETGMNCLHYCSVKDHSECAELLLKGGAKPCLRCDMGYFPIHIAAKCAAPKTLEVLIQQGLKYGYDRVTLLTFKDKENNMPLHAAVNGGNIKAVEVCLQAGAPVDTQQDDKSTPVHFAAAQGNLDMIKLMHSLQEENFMTSLYICDAMNMTPLHRAALFNHKAVVEFLLEKGVDINSKDDTGRTPLLLAASKGCWDTVQVLVGGGADVRVRDRNSQNFLHLAIRFGGKLGQFFCKEESLMDSNAKDATDGTVAVRTMTSSVSRVGQDILKLLDERDEFGCTPLHYASKEGHLLALEELITFGATPSLKNNEKQSPFHFAARYGRYNTCRRLLELSQGPNIINETDADGLTGLHIAAQNGHTKIITLLLQKGAVVQRDNDDNTPLHHAAAQGWTQCMRTLMGIHSHLLDVRNVRGETALHLAAQNGRVSTVALLLSMGASLEKDKAEKTFFDYVIELQETEVAMTVVKHDRWEEVLISHSVQFGCPFLGLIEHMPVICEAVLDRCQIYSEGDRRSVDHFIEYNYKFLNCPVECIEEAKKSGNFQPMMTLNAMVRHGRVNCLSHPVCVSFLRLKWNTYGLWFYMLVLGLYLLYLSCMTYFVVHRDSIIHHDKGRVENRTMDMLKGNDSEMTAVSKGAVWIITVYSILSMVKEVVQMITQKRRYFADQQNAFEWSLYITSLLFSGPFIFNLTFHWQWEAGALAVFMAWFNLLVILQRFDFFGIYVVMFLEILRTLLQALCVFSILIVAFGLSFHMLLSHEATHAYSTPGLSLLRTTMMMLELDYMASFNEPYTDDDNTTLHFGALTLFMVLVFVLLMPILLMNLLIGLAVGDIEAVQRNARLKRLAGQVELHSHMEGKMPLFLLFRFDQPLYRYYPNKCKNKMANFWTRMTANDREESVGGVDINRVALQEELIKQKKKMKEMGSVLEKNNQLLKLIVQKMEIHTEDEVYDEGYNHDGGCSAGSVPVANGPNAGRNINTNSLRRRAMQKSSIVSFMRNNWDKNH
ncbi:transient receptor potential cation channel subfamily A member 1-like isoform X2 [Littorina saxatilis]